VCSIDPSQLAAQQGQPAPGGAAPANGNPQQQGQAPQGQAPQGQGNAGGRGGNGGGCFGGFGGRGGNGGRWNLSLSHTIELGNKVLVAPGGPELDLLHGDALTGGGVARHTLSLEGGVFYNGFGTRISGSYKSGTRVNGTGGPTSSDLRFGDLFTLDLRMFADLGRQEKVVKAVPFLKNARLSFSVNNLFDAHQRVTDQNGAVPLRYQPDLVDPTGRSFQVEFRKLF
jgi:hypothetical protein